MGKPAFGEVTVLGVEDHRQIEGRSIFQCAAQVTVAGEFAQAIAEGDAAGFAQCHQFGKLLAGQVARECADWKYLGMT